MNWRGTVLLWEEFGLFLGAAGTASLHESPAIKVCLSLSGSFELPTSARARSSSYTGAVIPAGCRHGIVGNGHEMAMLLLAPEGQLGQKLASLTGLPRITEIPEAIRAALVTRLQPVRENPADGERGAALISQAVDLLEQSSEADAAPLDPRVARSIEWIRTGRESGILVKDIAAGVELSESRFSHLFTEHVRVPVRRYLLWLRLRDALHLLAKTASLTEIAHEAGFADSAHFTRTFRTALGIAPSALVRDSTLTSFLA